MEPADALTRIRESAALWSVGSVDDAELVGAALRVMAGRVVAGVIPPMDLAVWAYRTFRHDTPELAQRLVDLDDLYDTVEYTETTEADVDAAIVAEARRLARAHPK